MSATMTSASMHQQILTFQLDEQVFGVDGMLAWWSTQSRT